MYENCYGFSETRKVENPSLTGKVDLGDFVFTYLDDTISSIGLVSNIAGAGGGKQRVASMHFEFGNPFTVIRVPSEHTIRVVKVKDGIDYINAQRENLEKKFEQGGIKGALAASGANYLDRVMSSIKNKDKRRKFDYINFYEYLRTEAYVVLPKFKGESQPSEEYLFGIKSKLPGHIVKKIIEYLYPNGALDIIPKAKEKQFRDYNVYEVPERAKHLVHDLELKVNLEKLPEVNLRSEAIPPFA